MKNLKSKLSVLVLIMNSMIFANCSNSTPQSNISPIKVAGTTWMVEVEANFYDYITFNLDSTFVIYYSPVDETLNGHYKVKDGRIILHFKQYNYEDSSLKSSDGTIPKEDYLYVIINNELYQLNDRGQASKDYNIYKPAPQGWTPPPPRL